MQTRRRRGGGGDVDLWRHGDSSTSTSWSWSLSAAWNTASSSCRMMTYNLIEPEGVASLLKVNELAVDQEIG